MNPRHREPWGNACEWPPSGPTPDALADDVPTPDDEDDPERQVADCTFPWLDSDPVWNEAAAHDAMRHRERVIRNAVGRGGQL